jgi:hypothetical protein
MICKIFSAGGARSGGDGKFNELDWHLFCISWFMDGLGSRRSPAGQFGKKKEKGQLWQMLPTEYRMGLGRIQIPIWTTSGPTWC